MNTLWNDDYRISLEATLDLYRQLSQEEGQSLAPLAIQLYDIYPKVFSEMSRYIFQRFGLLRSGYIKWAFLLSCKALDFGPGLHFFAG